MFIFGETHGDLPLQETDGKVLAEFVVTEQVPVILSLRHLAVCSCAWVYPEVFRGGVVWRLQRDAMHVDQVRVESVVVAGLDELGLDLVVGRLAHFENCVGVGHTLKRLIDTVLSPARMRRTNALKVSSGSALARIYLPSPHAWTCNSKLSAHTGHTPYDPNRNPLGRQSR